MLYYDEIAQSPKQMLELEQVFGEFAHRVKLINATSGFGATPPNALFLEKDVSKITVIGSGDCIPMGDAFDIIDGDEDILVQIPESGADTIFWLETIMHRTKVIRLGSTKYNFQNWIKSISGIENNIESEKTPDSIINNNTDLAIHQSKDKISVVVKTSIHRGDHASDISVSIDVNPEMTIGQLMDRIFNKGIKYDKNTTISPNKLEDWVELRISNSLGV